MGARVRMVRRRGFTLIDILIVVVLLGILAAVVLIQLRRATEDAKAAATLENLQTMRSRIQAYKVEHLDKYPTSSFTNQMTRYSDASGNTKTTSSAVYRYGPYLRAVPLNPYSASANLRVVTTPVPASFPQDRGWVYSTVTGNIWADLKSTHTTSDGIPLNRY